MIKAEEAYKKVMQSLVNLSNIENEINKAIENKKFEIILNLQGNSNRDKIYKILSDYFTPLGYAVFEYYFSYQYIGIKISWDLE